MIGAVRLLVTACLAEVLTMVGVFAFPALLPEFTRLWALDKTQAGWIAGVYFVAYALVAPVVVSLTDHVDARRVYLGGALTAALASAGYAFLADGFASALALRALAGAGLAATYMPGLRVVVDRYRGAAPSRAVACYTASFSLGTAGSFLLAGLIAQAFGWRAAFATAALAALLGGLLVAGLPRVARPERAAVEPRARILDFRPVLANRPAMAFILGYAVHCWELFTLRSWLVAFLAFVLARDAEAPLWLSPTLVATLGALVATAASLGGNELALRRGRTRAITWAMVLSTTMACGFGFASALPYLAAAALSLLYIALVQLDTAALTAGAVAAATPGRQGATLALHAVLGFGAAGIGPLVFGMVLDGTGGGGTPSSWGLAFLSVALVGLLGPLALRLGREWHRPNTINSKS